MTRHSLWLIALPFVAWLLVFHQSLLDMVHVWGSSKTYEHCYLIVPISLWVVWQQRNAVRATTLDYAWLPAVLLVLPMMLWLVGRAASIALFEHAAAIVSLQLLLWAILGNAMSRLLWFPILYLWFCIPFGEEFVPRLQVITADLSVYFLRLTDVPVYRDGLYLTVPNGLFFVAEACSGIRFLISSVALGTLFAYLQFTKTWKRIAFIGFSFIFPIIANGIRAYGIVLVGYMTDMEHATGADHLVYGWVFFSIVILCIFGVAALFSDPSKAPSTPHNYFKSTQPHDGIKVVGIMTVLFLSVAMWGYKITHSEQAVVTASTLPEGIAVGVDSSWGIDFPKAQHTTMAVTTAGDATLYSARYALWQVEGELISHENHLFDPDVWSIKQTQTLAIGEETDAKQLLLTNSAGRTLQVVYWYCIDTYCSGDPLKIKLYHALHLLRGGSGYADIFALSSQSLGAKALGEQARQWQRLTIKRPE